MADLRSNELERPRLEPPGAPPMFAARKCRALLVALLSAVLPWSWGAVPAHALRFDPHPGCGALCEEEFWTTAVPREIATTLTEQRHALDYRRYMLRLAVRAGNVAGTKALLRAGAPPNGREMPGRYDSMLHEAARRGGELVEVLLDAGAFPNVVIKGGVTPLHVAAQWGQVRTVASLLEAGADPRTPTSGGLTALELVQRTAAENCQIDANRADRRPPSSRSCKDDLLALLRGPPDARAHCGRLCDAKYWRRTTTEEVRNALAQAPPGRQWSAPNGSPLHLALATGADAATVTLLLDHGIDLNGRDVRDDTPLHVAARRPGAEDLVALLLQRGAWRDALNGRDWTPLHAASERASTVNAMRVLLDAGADPDARAGAMFGETPRELAVAQPDGPAAARLILSYPGIRGISPRDLPARLLQAAAAGGHPDTVELLLRRGADADDPDIFGSSPLHAAAAAGNIGTMRVLLRHGAEPGYSKYDAPLAVVSGEGERPLHLAVRHPAAVELLLTFGASPNGRMLSGETPLHDAASTCAGASLLLLLEHGADPNVQDQYGDTPLHDAVWRVANAEENDWRRQEWLAKCENAATERTWHLEQCRSDATLQFQEDLEARDECRGNIAALLRFGADPNIVDTEIGSSGGVTPFEMASRPDVRKRLGPALFRMMEEASAVNAR